LHIYRAKVNRKTQRYEFKPVDKLWPGSIKLLSHSFTGTQAEYRGKERSKGKAREKDS